MQFLKSLFWASLIIVMVIFSIANWSPVTINLWNGLQLDTWLPLPLVAAFMLGLLPYFVLHRATRWSMSRKLASAERALADQSANPSPAIVHSTPPPPAATPMAVPPGVS